MTTPDGLSRATPGIDARVAIIAGEGRLPLDIAEQLRETGASPLVVLAGRPERTAAGLLAFEHCELPPERALDLVPLLRARRVTHAVLAGEIAKRPKWSEFRPSWTLFRLLPTVARALRKGDDGLLRIFIRHIEENGIEVVGAHELLPDMVAPSGALTAAQPSSKDRRDLDAALEAARAIGALDIGQAAVAVGGRVIALEGIEGTDGLLERVASLRSHGRIAGVTRGVLVKCAKPKQEMRVDLPTIGPDTVTRAAAAGLAGIGVEAARSIIVQKKQVIEEADRLGLFVFGVG